MIEVTITCKECGSGINVHPNAHASEVVCQICQTPAEVNHKRARKWCSQRLSGLWKKRLTKKDFNRKLE